MNELQTRIFMIIYNYSFKATVCMGDFYVRHAGLLDGNKECRSCTQGVLIGIYLIL